MPGRYLLGRQGEISCIGGGGQHQGKLVLLMVVVGGARSSELFLVTEGGHMMHRLGRDGSHCTLLAHLCLKYVQARMIANLQLIWIKIITSTLPMRLFISVLSENSAPYRKLMVIVPIPLASKLQKSTRGSSINALTFEKNH